ncbi:RNA polymerase sigma factor [Hymenobacter armeniacus]|uniref:RNA polymerase sigma-70 factor n=1 Tax=Hymenobacter armeniacus TaxID=2771358 RepID=A0ABR8JW07_9BACT|nr:RNA polymerase sigma-70 factor [Hymenobacter armeniacus]MBD2723101.1 RNA polymerase sigma-70 factor [Hymenobacter armeniacus]
MNIGNWTDEALVAGIKNDNEAAFEEVYNRYWQRLYALARYKTDGKETAEEIVQDLFLTLWAGRQQLQLTSSLETYLFTAVKYKVIKYYKARMVRDSYARQQLKTTSGAGNFTEHVVDFGDVSTTFQQGLLSLSQKSRQIFTLSRFENLSNKEIGAALSLTEKAVEYHISKALKLFRVILKDCAA